MILNNYKLKVKNTPSGKTIITKYNLPRFESCEIYFELFDENNHKIELDPTDYDFTARFYDPDTPSADPKILTPTWDTESKSIKLSLGTEWLMENLSSHNQTQIYLQINYYDEFIYGTQLVVTWFDGKLGF